MRFGDVAYSGSGFVFWSVSPFLLVTAISIPLMIQEADVARATIGLALSIGCLLAILALRDSDRYWWAARGVTGLIFLLYAGYVVYECFLSGKPFLAPGAASPVNSLLGLVVIGLPALWYTLLGRFTLWRPTASAEDELLAAQYWEAYYDEAEGDPPSGGRQP